MTEIQFSNNFGDKSDRAGFQFDFYCEKCRDAWRSPYTGYTAGQASGLLHTAGSIFGGLFGKATTAVDYARDAGYRSAKDKAFAAAVEAAKVHFKRCLRCANYVCAKCYNGNLNQCTTCAPAVQQEADAAARAKEIEMAMAGAQKAVEAGKKTDTNVVCGSCGARVPDAKFCAECGGKIALTTRCPGCNAELQPSAKFCPECGGKR